MQTVQLYINNTRIDLFKDEDISLNESIRNAKDIAKVFTTFSKQFTVPASKTNNKVFKHYYNFNITGGFDARVTQTARIEINDMPYKEGRIRLLGVKMKNNAPSSYNVVFFGSIVDLKDILGEDRLTSLDDLSALDLSYTDDDIITALTAAPGETALPLVTADQRLYYDTLDTLEGTGNLYYQSGKIRGVNPRQLKYAVRLDKIVDAIESKYPEITFTSNSFFHDATKDIHKLYMWCHRKKGQITVEAGASQLVTFDQTSGLPEFNIDADGYAVLETDVSGPLRFKFQAILSSGGKYDLVIRRNDVIYHEAEGLTTSYTFSSDGDILLEGDKFTAEIRTYDEGVIFTSLAWIMHIVEFDGAPAEDLQVTYANLTTYQASFIFNIKKEIPDQKVIDFLSNLFKMFNLVAYVNDDGEIDVQPLDVFYANPTVHDITDYVDSSEGEVNVALPYKEIFFKYKDTKTILAAQHIQELSDIEWGANEYTDPTNLYGDIYKVEPSFNHSKFEKLLDLSNGTLDTGIMYGYYVDDNQNAYLGDPFILYIDQAAISVDMSINNNGVLEKFDSGTLVNMPSNLEDIVDETSNCIHFDSEFSEYDGLLAEQTLFKRFYENYILNIFDEATRISKVTAYLPINKVVKLGQEIKLSDIVILNGNRYRINNMNINLTTGKTDFELINYYD